MSQSSASEGDVDARDPGREDREPPVQPSLAGAATRGFLWTTLAWGGNRLVVLALTALLARLLVPEDFGLVTAGLTIITFFDAALDLGVGYALVYEQERGINARVRLAAGLNLVLSAAICAIGVAASPFIARLFGESDQTELFAVLFLYPLFRGAAQVNDAILKRDMLFKKRTVADLTRAAVRVVVSIPLALTGFGAWSIALGIIAGEAACMVFLWSLVPIRPDFRLRWSRIRTLVSFGGAVTGVRVLGSFRSSVDYLFIGAVLGSAALGYYGMGYRLPELIIANVLWIFTTVAFPVYARARIEGLEKLRATMLRATRLVALFGLAAGVALAVLAPLAIPVVFSETWEPAVVPMALVSLALACQSLGWASGDVFSALGRPGLLLALDIPATILVTIAFGVAAQQSIAAVAAVHIGFEIVYAIIRVTLAVRVTGVAAAAMARTLAPAFATGAAIAAVGLPLRSVLPEDSFWSLLALTTACGVTAAVVGGLTARREVLGVLSAVRNRVAPAGSRQPAQ
ncbi:polysaccharide transporter, PST family [Cryptosporangium aurantiacum]|uniref:Polysaccharide transporter, PST family n=1 Tax=Cryptosporangium aurantiacum TaxID=134849 RepID=A0A1M7RDB3_9ACTN|nr:polysaccharide transporter, PST family [Cryptosporangium aurantiacum]